MVEYLNKVLLGSLFLFLFAANAENLPDPTRPPAGLGTGAGGEVDRGPVLQSVLISATRRIAIISGKTVKVGDKYGDAQVVSITEGEVVLRNGKEKEILKLYPSLYKPGSDGPKMGR